MCMSLKSEPFQKMGEKKVAPLKLFPIIKEVFSSIDRNLVEHLPTSEENNHYVLIAM